MNVLILGSTGVLGNSLKLFLKNKKKMKLNFIARNQKKSQNII